MPLNGRQDLSCPSVWDWLAPREPWEDFPICYAKFQLFFNIWGTKRQSDLVFVLLFLNFSQNYLMRFQPKLNANRYHLNFFPKLSWFIPHVLHFTFWNFKIWLHDFVVFLSLSKIRFVFIGWVTVFLVRYPLVRTLWARISNVMLLSVHWAGYWVLLYQENAWSIYMRWFAMKLSFSHQVQNNL